MAGQSIEIDTKEICLLCYDPYSKGDPVKSLSSLTGFKQLLRYLNVDVKELFNCTPEFLQWIEIGNEIDVQIAFCEKCSIVTEQFHKLYKQYEMIQFQFDKCVEFLHQSMKNGDENDERLREFKRRMRPNKSFDLINASIATNLRNKTFKKCELKLQNSIPRIALPKISGSTQTLKILDNALNQDHQTVDVQITGDKQFPHATIPVQSPHLDDIINEMSQLQEETDTQMEMDDVESPNNLIYLSSDSEAEPITGSNQLPKKRLLKRKGSLPNYKVNRETQDENPVNSMNVIDHCVSLEHNLKIVAVTSQRPNVHPEGETSHSTQQMDDVEIDTNIIESTNMHIPLYTPPSKRLNNQKDFNHSKWIMKMMRKKNLSCCDICQMSFTQVTALRRHYYVNHSEYVISECSSSKLSLDQLKTPINDLLEQVYSISFSEKGGFECCYCQIPLKQKFDYKYHLMRYHTNEIARNIDQSSSEQTFALTLGPNLKSKPSTSSQYPCRKCKYCEYTSNFSCNVRYHTLDIHTVELVLPLMNPGTCKVKCCQAAEAILNGLKVMDGKCPKCPCILVNKSGLKRHILGRHFDEFVQDLKCYLAQDEVVEEGVEGEYQEEMFVPVEFGEENLKVELMENLHQQSQPDPLGFERL